MGWIGWGGCETWSRASRGAVRDHAKKIAGGLNRSKEKGPANGIAGPTGILVFLLL
jgi:hypothetical protein